MEDSTQQERILAYLDGQMTKEEVDSFEQEVTANPLLQKEVDQLLRSKAAAFQIGKQEYKEQLLKEWDSWESTEKTQIQTTPMWKKVSIAASIAFLLGMGLYFLRPATQVSAEDLFIAYYEHPEAGSIRELSTSNSALVLANQSYIKGDFKNAIQLYEALLQPPAQESDEIHFYLGISYLREGQSDAAIEQFSQLEATGFQASGQWYSMLVHLQQGRVDQVKQACQSLIQAGNHPYREAAEKLLNELE